MLYGIVDVHFFFFFFFFSFFFFFFFFRHDFVRPITLEPLLAETPNWVCCLVLWSSCTLLLTIQFASLSFFFLFLFFSPKFVQAISLEPLLAETPKWVCCLVLRSNFALLLTTQFASLFFSFFSRHDFATILSGPYLWNRYLQRLQIECAAWFCGLIVHYWLPSHSLRYLFFFFRPISGTLAQTLQIECAAWSCGLVVHCRLPSNSLRYFFFFPPWFCHDFVRGISLEPLLAETPNWVCYLVLQSNCALLLTIQFASLFFVFVFVFSATILSGPYLWNRYSQRLQIECAAWSCGLIVHCCLPSASLC